MRSQDIRAELKRRAIPIISIGRELGVSGPAIHRVISGDSRSRAIELAIAEKLGVERDVIFGGGGPSSGPLVEHELASVG